MKDAIPFQDEAHSTVVKRPEIGLGEKERNKV